MKSNFREAKNSVMYLLHDRYNFKKDIRYLKLSLKNGHPFIYFSLYTSKAPLASINFFNNKKIKLYIKSNCYNYENFIFDKNDSHKKYKALIDFIYENNPFDSHYDSSFLIEFDYENYSCVRKKIKITTIIKTISFSKKYISDFLINFVLEQNKLSCVFFDNGCSFKSDATFHMRNDFLKIYSYIKFKENNIFLYKKEFNTKEHKCLYTINLSEYIDGDNFKEYYLTNELNKIKKIIRNQL